MIITRLRGRLRRAYWASVAPGRIRRYLRANGTRKLQVGCGSNLLEGWLNTDLHPFCRGTVRLDATRRFPLPDRSFDYVFSEHAIEHVEFEQAARMLNECFRITKPGGRIRIATVDLARIIALYAQSQGQPQQAYIRWIMDTFRPGIGEYNPVHVVNQSFHGWRHKFIYDRPTLAKAIRGAGFTQVERFEPGRSGDEQLRGIEQHGDHVGNVEAMLYETMVFEAVRP